MPTEVLRNNSHCQLVCFPARRQPHQTQLRAYCFPKTAAIERFPKPWESAKAVSATTIAETLQSVRSTRTYEAERSCRLDRQNIVRRDAGSARVRCCEGGCLHHSIRNKQSTEWHYYKLTYLCVEYKEAFAKLVSTTRATFANALHNLPSVTFALGTPCQPSVAQSLLR